MMHTIEIDKEHFIKICNESKSMAQAAVALNLHFNTFKRYADKLGCYKPNRGRKGFSKKSSSKISTEDILNGEYPEYQTYKLKLRLLREGIIEDMCSLCGWSKKLEGQPYSPCELHHINGNAHDHRLSNLQMLCPNCHSITANYRFRKEH